MGKNTKARKKYDSKDRTKTRAPRDGRNHDKVALPNNPSWYATNSQLLKDVASIPFSSVLGTDLDIGLANDGGFPIAVPGILQINYAHSLGCGRTSTDAPTVAARYLYTYVRHANSGSANYEAPDLYLMIMAWHSANAFLTHAKRAYGAMMHYLPKNRFFAETVVRAMGFDFQSLHGNLANFRSMINQFAAQLNSIKVPADMPLGKRWNQLASEYYVDGTSTKAQLYIPKCTEYLVYDGYGSETGTSLVPETTPSAVIDFDAFVQVMRRMLRPLLSEEDVGIMSGDIMKAFGDKVSTVELIDESYATIPILSDEMLMQFHNLIIPGEHVIAANTERRVFQENGVIIEDYIIRRFDTQMNYLPSLKYANSVLLDIKGEDTSPEAVMTCTRFIPGGVEDLGSRTILDEPAFNVVNTGSEIVTSIKMYLKPTSPNPVTGLPEDNVGEYETSFIHVPFGYDTNDPESVNQYVNALNLLASIGSYLPAFDWAPKFYTQMYNIFAEPDPVKSYMLPSGEYDNFTVVDLDVIARLNNIAILSELSTTSHTSI